MNRCAQLNGALSDQTARAAGNFRFCGDFKRLVGAQRRIRTVPGFIAPMLSKTVAELPGGDDWIYEVKRGGKRAIAVKDGRRVKLYRENGQRLECPAVE